MPNTLFHLQFPTPPGFNLFTRECFFESFDGLYKHVIGSGEVTDTGSYVQISSQAAKDAGGYLQEDLEYPYQALTWDKKRTLTVKPQIRHDNDPTGLQYIVTGTYAEVGNGFGFKFVPDKIQGWTRNADGDSTIDLLTGLGNNWTATKLLEATLNPAQNVEFYIDGVLKGTKTTNVPAGTTQAKKIFLIYLYSGKVAIDWIRLSQIKVTQEL